MIKYFNEEIKLLNSERDERKELDSGDADLLEKVKMINEAKNRIDNVKLRLDQSKCLDLTKANFDQSIKALITML